MIWSGRFDFNDAALSHEEYFTTEDDQSDPHNEKAGVSC
jgi:hypothetical protein